MTSSEICLLEIPDYAAGPACKAQNRALATEIEAREGCQRRHVGFDKRATLLTEMSKA